MSARGGSRAQDGGDSAGGGSSLATRRCLKLVKALCGHEALVRIEGDDVHLTRTDCARANRAGANVVAARTLQVPLAQYRQLLAQGQLETRGSDRVAVSAQGRAWLRRALSCGDGFADQHRETEPRTLTDDARESPCGFRSISAKARLPGSPGASGPMAGHGSMRRRSAQESGCARITPAPGSLRG